MSAHLAVLRGLALEHRSMNQAHLGGDTAELLDDVMTSQLRRLFEPATDTHSEPRNVKVAWERLVLPADPDQRAVVSDALAGVDLLVQGPPGAGKTQTIVNVAAAISVYERRVLILTARPQALDVIARRLADAGLGDFVLTLDPRRADGEILRCAHEALSTRSEADRRRVVDVAPAHQAASGDPEQTTMSARWGLTPEQHIRRLFQLRHAADLDVDFDPVRLPATLIERLHEHLIELRRLDAVLDRLVTGARTPDGPDAAARAAGAAIDRLCAMRPPLVVPGWADASDVVRIARRVDKWKGTGFELVRLLTHPAAEIPATEIGPWLSTASELLADIAALMEAAEMPTFNDFVSGAGHLTPHAVRTLTREWRRQLHGHGRADLIRDGGPPFAQLLDAADAIPAPADAIEKLVLQRLHPRRADPQSRPPLSSPTRFARNQATTRAMLNISCDPTRMQWLGIAAHQRHPAPRLSAIDEEAWAQLLDAFPITLATADALARYCPSSLRFDACVIDEASQLRPIEAAKAVRSARQLVVFGDEHQMPPSDTFRPRPDLSQEAPIFESAFDLCSAAPRFRRAALTWVYRARDQRLLDFSNAEWYRGRLRAFPDPTARGAAPVRLIRVEGTYDRGGSRTNPVEARAAIDVARQLLTEAGGSACIVTLSSAQAACIERLLGYPKGGPWSGWEVGSGTVSVRNLERVQGEEFDHVIITCGYGPDQTGRTSRTFGSLNRTGADRRLNVAITRARTSLTVVTSLDVEELASADAGDPVDVLSRLLRWASSAGELPAGPGGSPLAGEIAAAIVERGLVPIVTDFGVALHGDASRIPLMIVPPDTLPSIASTADERDALAAMLQARGWLVEIPSTTVLLEGPTRWLDRVLRRARQQEEPIVGVVPFPVSGVTAAGASVRGTKHTRNHDHFVIAPDMSCIVVLDGVTIDADYDHGRYVADAAALLISELTRHHPNVALANVHEWLQQRRRRLALVVAVVGDQVVDYYSVGDCRVWGDSRRGRKPVEDTRGRTDQTRYLGSAGELVVETFALPLGIGDSHLLCTDGVATDAETIHRALTVAEPARIVEVVDVRPYDDATAVLLRREEPR